DRVEFTAARRLAAAARVAPFAVLDHLRRPLQAADLADAGDVPAVPLDAELEVLVRVEPLRVRAELGHACLLEESDRRASQVGHAWAAICWSLRMTNSAGFSGAKPTTMLTTPLFWSVGVVVSASHFTK